MRTLTVATLVLSASFLLTSCAVERQTFADGSESRWYPKEAPVIRAVEPRATMAPEAGPLTASIGPEVNNALPIERITRTPVAQEAEHALREVRARKDNTRSTVERDASVVTSMTEDHTTVRADQRGGSGAAAMPTVPGSGNMNTWAIVGFICSLFVPILGLIFSIIALGQIKRTGERGYGFALAGLIISIVTMLIVIAILA